MSWLKLQSVKTEGRWKEKNKREKTDKRKNRPVLDVKKFVKNKQK